MSHARTQIRESIATLVTGLATTGSRVFQSRMRPQDEASLPCLLVTTNDESIDQSIGDTQTRALSVTVRGFAMGATVDDTLDQIALEVETALADHYRASLDRLEVDFEDDGLQKPVGSITLNYRYQYFTAAGNPAVMI